MPTVPFGSHRLGAAVSGCLLVAAACAPAERAVAPAPTPSLATAPAAGGGTVVISAIYGGGGNASATYTHDYVELYNRSDAAVSVDGWTLQYGSNTGLIGGTNGNQLVALSGTIPAGAYRLVRAATGGNVGAPLPVTPDFTWSQNLSATAGKLALVRRTTGLGCGTTAVQCDAAALADVADLVGYGSSATQWEGATRAPGPTSNANTTAIRRLGGGATDTDVNGADFELVSPAPAPRGGSQGGIVVTVTASPATISVNGTTSVAVAVTSNNQPVVPSSITWSASPQGRVALGAPSGTPVTVTGLSAGTATVTATVVVSGTQYQGSTTVTVSQPAATLYVEGYSFRGNDPLPVGFQELYRVRDGSASAPYIRSGITWSTSDASVATVDALGNVTAVAPGSVNVIATETATGRTGQWGLTVVTPTWSDTVGVYANPLQFGTPTDADPSDDVVIRRQTFAASWSDALGQPRWVAYNLDGSHRPNTVDRCDCFTPDPLLPAGSKLVTSADYDGSNYSRGHMTMSADRTRALFDNATTFYWTNIIPQTQQNNGGPWLGLEIFLGDQARQANKEVFIIAGGARYEGWLQSANPLLAGQQRVAIPTWTWKVAVILDRDRGFADVRSASDVRVIAVAMPNTFTIPQVQADWVNYRASVDSIERLTGYDVLAALPDDVEALVEAQLPATRAVAMDVQPGRISVASTATVSAALLSGTDFDATSFNPADLRLVTQGRAQVAPISRGTVVNTSTRDVNGDGRLDRVVNFSVAQLRQAGFGTATPALTLRLAGAGTPAWLASDVTPATVAP